MPLYSDGSAYPNGKGGENVAFDTPVPANIQASSANAAAANNVAMAAVAGLMNFCTGFEITGGGATAAGLLAVTLVGPATTMNYVFPVPAGATVGALSLIVEFSNPVPASAINTAITLNVPSFGAGNTTAAVSIHGFRA